jgi:3-dehydrosphinganine reductase
MAQAVFNNKFAIVVGGSEGIGLAVAQELIRRGSNVLVASRHQEKLTQAADVLKKNKTRVDQWVETIAMDVSDFMLVNRQLISTVERHGAPDLLVNAAGFTQSGYLEDLSVDVLRDMMTVNYLGTLHVVKSLLPAMRKAGRGHIVNVSSMAGYLGLFGYTGYCASKYAVIGFSWALRHELKPYGITVSVLCPPNTRTPGLERENKTKPNELLEMERRIKALSAADVATATLNAIPKRPFLINPSLSVRMAHLASRLAPTWIADIILRRPVVHKI